MYCGGGQGGWGLFTREQRGELEEQAGFLTQCAFSSSCEMWVQDVRLCEGELEREKAAL